MEMRRVYLDVVFIFSPAPLLQAPVGHRQGVSTADEGEQPSPRGWQYCLGEEGPFNDAGTVGVADVAVGKAMGTWNTTNSRLSPVPLSSKLLNLSVPSSINIVAFRMSSLKGCVEWPRGGLQLTGRHQRRFWLHRPRWHQHAAARGNTAVHS